MAKLYENSESDEEFPELSTILRRPRQSSPNTTGKGYGKKRVIAEDGELRQSQSIQEYAKNLPEIITKITCNEKPTSKQRPLKLAHVNSLLLSVNRAEKQKKTTGAKTDQAEYSPRLRPTPKRVIKSSIGEDDSTSTLHGLSMPKGGESIDDLSDFVLEDSTDDSDDDDEKTSLRVHVKKPEELNLTCSPSRGATIGLTSPKRPTSVLRSKPGRRIDSQVSENYVEGEPGAQLKLWVLAHREGFDSC